MARQEDSIRDVIIEYLFIFSFTLLRMKPQLTGLGLNLGSEKPIDENIFQIHCRASACRLCLLVYCPGSC